MIAQAPPAAPADRRDRLFRLLPPVLQLQDAFAGQALRALLRVMAEQADLVEDDVARLLENWFVETCDDWALAYLGELVGYRPVPGVGTVPRQEVADTVRHRRRKGALLLLEELARSAAGWPARAVEFGPLAAAAAHARFPGLERGDALRARAGDEDDRGLGPFSTLLRRPDARRLASARTPGRGGVAGVGLYVWRLRVHQVRRGQACQICPSPGGPPHYYRYTFDPYGDDRPLFTAARSPAPEPTQPAAELDVPGPIRRRAFAARPGDYYGPVASLFALAQADDTGVTPVELAAVVPARLDRWEARFGDDLPRRLPDRHLAIDPETGRLLLHWVQQGPPTFPLFWVSYHTGFSADIGGGGYPRPLDPVPADQLWQVRPGPTDAAAGVFGSLAEALDAWDTRPEGTAPGRHVVIRIEDDATHDLLGRRPAPALALVTPSRVTRLGPGDRLEVRAASGRRPVIKLQSPGCPTHRSWRVESAAADAAFVLDGVRLGGPRQVEDPDKPEVLSAVPIAQPGAGFLGEGGGPYFRGLELRLVGPFQEARVRHATLTPGRARLVLERFSGCVAVESSVLGPVLAEPVEAPVPAGIPPRLIVTDSILDGREGGDPAVGVVRLRRPDGPEGDAHDAPKAFVHLTAARVTAFGPVQVYSLDSAQDSIFSGGLMVARTELGCVRFSSVTYEDVLAASTPPRYECQPDLAVAQLLLQHPGASPADRRAAANRVRPRFSSGRYGDPRFAQLAASCPTEVARGAEDGSEMGAFHDLHQPQREALLRARLAEFTPAGADAQLFFAT